MRIDGKKLYNHETLERARSEYESLLTVLMARISTAKDLEDWSVIVEQTDDLEKLARSARIVAGVLEKQK